MITFHTVCLCLSFTELSVAKLYFASSSVEHFQIRPFSFRIAEYAMHVCKHLVSSLSFLYFDFDLFAGTT
jgi:hypothetical protein